MSGETNRMTALAQAIQDTPSLREMDVLLTTGEQVSISLLANSTLRICKTFEPSDAISSISS
jgi:aspartokinase